MTTMRFEHLLLAPATRLRSQLCCQTCGCGGRCTTFAIQKAIARSLKLWSERTPPLTRPASLVEFGADLEEQAGALGLKSYRNADCPCNKCSCTKANMHCYSLALTLPAFCACGCVLWRGRVLRPTPCTHHTARPCTQPRPPPAPFDVFKGACGACGPRV